MTMPRAASRTWRVFTDGACKGNNRMDKSTTVAGCGVYILRDREAPALPHPAPHALRYPEPSDKIWQLAFKCPGKAANNRAEIAAIVGFFEAVDNGRTPIGPGDTVFLFTDSQPAIDTTTWMHGWKRNGWRLTNKSAPPKNLDLVKKLYDGVMKWGNRLSLTKVPAHKSRPAGPASSDEVLCWFGNQQADLLAQLGAGVNAFPSVSMYARLAPDVDGSVELALAKRRRIAGPPREEPTAPPPTPEKVGKPTETLVERHARADRHLVRQITELRAKLREAESSLKFLRSVTGKDSSED